MKNPILHFCVLIPLFFFNVSCIQENGDVDQTEKGPIVVKVAYPNLTFERPVDFQNAGDNSNRTFIVEQRGVISVFPNDPTVTTKQVFLNIESKVKDQGNEEGLLGLAFHPNYETNGFFYVNYTAANPNRTVISRFQVSASNINQANPASELVLMEIAQPFSNHNGGQVAFGPDGFLYIAVGDGGSGGDPQNHGQNPKTLLGTILRIDVDSPSGSLNYSIPLDNPFVINNASGIRAEIYAYGLRNPWRFSFDTQNGRLWVGDVGQNRAEEIDIVTNGGNYGWRTMEGFECYNPANNCNQTGLQMPIVEYGRSNGDVSVTGGFVYRGTTLDELKGLYIYGDFVSGRIWTLNHANINNPINTELMKASFPIASFGVDQQNELYICGFDGKIYKFGYE
ncbi:PQQ-dependent sugar dehydrogenase [Cognataquiflexum rubidum]|uniref:PQQ-dependent sugar dehydrogenase n=1 Tax=Cognataquiflexum rubidum TaxID=2922273 RepID=UPI001F135981|nr:PQQ-dependent sugar dehydrogenase [Cognataquiflexum rubidum]MCH6234262.1 PQQ-dependent sugar dehydrogenase [Cognataquiflexum rubidum]